MKKKIFKDLLLSISQMRKMRRSMKKKLLKNRKTSGIPDSNLEKKWAREAKWEKTHPILTKFKRLWWWIRYGIKNKLENIPLSVRSFIQRGKRGWSNRDTWGLDYYLANIIEKTIQHLKKNSHGFPANLTEGKWVDILNTISDTFYFAKKCSDGKLYLIRNERKRKQWQKALDEINKKCDGFDRCMTEKEIQVYDLGWKYFQTYFFNLWD